MDSSSLFDPLPLKKNIGSWFGNLSHGEEFILNSKKVSPNSQLCLLYNIGQNEDAVRFIVTCPAWLYEVFSK